jgi:cyclophilin family peptidyl-prolyl cis-trans isomerase/plastocyanin
MFAAMLFPLSSARAQELEFAPGQTVVVDVQLVYLRAGPGPDWTVVTSLFRGNELTIEAEPPEKLDGNVWWSVSVVDRDEIGWVPDTAISAQDPATTATESTSSADCWTAEQAVEVDGNPNWTDPPAMVIDPESEYLATIATTKGEIVIELDAENAPIATNNFYCLAHAGYYDHTDFHRISADFLIQGGDPTGTGIGTPGYVVPSDPTTGLYPAGSLALANSAPDQNGAQFFIAAADLTGEIPDDYPVFGQVTSGLDIVGEISRSPVEANPQGELSAPRFPITVTRVDVTIIEEQIGPPIRPQIPTASTEPTVTIAPTVAMPPSTNAVIELDAKDIAFEPTTITIDATNLPATIRMENTGAALHNFSIDALGIDIDVNPGETVSILIPSGTAPGTYEFYCNVPGHTEAGMIGELVVTGVAPTPIGSVETDVACSDFETYRFSYNMAVSVAFLSNPEAIDVYTEHEDDEDPLVNLSDAELTALEALFGDLALGIAEVDPPSFAAEWHQLQVESFVLFANVFADAQVVGAERAEDDHSQEHARLEREVLLAISAAESCAEFVSWATEESILL